MPGEQIIKAAETLGPQNPRVKTVGFRSLLALSNPDEGGETIGSRAEYGFHAKRIGSNNGLKKKSLKRLPLYHRAFFQLVHERLKLVKVEGLGAVA